MPGSQKPSGFRFTLVNFLTLPAILMLPFGVVLLIATKGFTSDGSIGTALQIFQWFLYLGPLLLIGWTIWVFRRLRRYPAGLTLQIVNRAIMVLPYGIVLAVGGYFAWQNGYAYYQKQQTLETRSASSISLPDSLADTHQIGFVDPAAKTALVVPDSSVPKGKMGVSGTFCLINLSWKQNQQRMDTNYYPSHKVHRFEIKGNALLPKSLGKQLNSDCLRAGANSSKPGFTGLSRYGKSEGGKDQFEAYVAGEDRIEPVLIGFEPFDYQILNDIIADHGRRSWFFLRKDQTLFAGFLAKQGESKIYKLKGEMELPDARLKPDIKGLRVNEGKVWFYSSDQIFQFNQ